MRRSTFLLFLTTFFALQLNVFGQFNHPGMLHNEADFSRMKAKVAAGEEPWQSGYEALTWNYHSESDYSLWGPLEYVNRGASSGWNVDTDGDGTADSIVYQNFNKLFNDAAAAYQNALRWKITDNEAHAIKAIEILNAWGSTLKAIGGSTDYALSSGFQGYQMANAAEIMRTYSGWSSSDIDTFKQMLMNAFGGASGWYLFGGDGIWNAGGSDDGNHGDQLGYDDHHGTREGYYWANWDLGNMATLMSIGIFCDDTALYNQIVQYYKYSRDNGGIEQLVNPVYGDMLGQYQESGRDQGHSAIGPPLAAIICEMAWKQGDDLYGYDDNKLLKGAEYVAKYNLGNTVPYTDYYHPNNHNLGSQLHGEIASGGRGIFRPGWDLIYNHYVVRQGLEAPFTSVVAQKIRPDGGGEGCCSGGYDLIGFSTLTATLEQNNTKQDQTITFPDALPAIGKFSAPVDPGATASSGLAVYYTIDDNWLAELENGKIKCMNDPGTIAVTAWQPGNDKYNAAEPVTRNIQLNGFPTVPAPSLEGKYAFTVASTGMAIDVASASTSEGATILMWSASGNDNQKWTLTEISTGSFKIVNINSGLALDVVDNSNTAGTQVTQSIYTGEDYQLWQVTEIESGKFTFINNGNGLALSVQNASTSQGTVYVVDDYTGGAHQQFFGTNENRYYDIQYFDDMTFRFETQATYFTMDVPGASTADGAAVKTYYNNGGLNQQWRLENVSGNYFKIINRNSEKALDVLNNSNVAGTIVEQRTYNGEDYQLWEVIHNGDKTVTFVNKGNGLTLGIQDGLASQGINFVVDTHTGEPYQRFYHNMIETKEEQLITFEVIPEIYPGDADYTLQATSNNPNIPITFTSSNPNVAEIINGNVLRMKDYGVASIVATQDGDATHLPASDITRVVYARITQGMLVAGQQYTISAQHSGQFMDVANSSTSDGGNIQQMLDDGDNSQQWILEDGTDGYFKLRNVNSNKYLDISSASTSNGGNAIQWTGGTGTNQEFSITPSTVEGYYTISPRHSGKCIDVSGASTTEGANILQWTCSGSTNQNWSFNLVVSALNAPLETGTEKITPKTEDQVIVYPNPIINNTLSLDFNQTLHKKVNISIYDITGKTVFSKDAVLTGSKVALPSYIGAGIYALHIFGADLNRTVKIMVK